MSNNTTHGYGQFNHNPQGIPLYPQPPNTLKRKLPPQSQLQSSLQQQQLQQQYQQYQQYQQQLQQQQQLGAPPNKLQKVVHRGGNGVPVAVVPMFNPNQAQQGHNFQQSPQLMFQGQGQPQPQPPNALQQQNVQGQPGQQPQQPQQRRFPVPTTEEEKQRYINHFKTIIERCGADSPQAKSAQAQLRTMMQYMQQQKAAQQGQSTQGADQQGGTPVRVLGHPVSSPAQFQPPQNADPQALQRFRLSLTSRYTQGQQKMKQIREQLQIHSTNMNQLQQAGQPPENPQILQIKQTMNELAKQFKTIEGWCLAARNSGHILQNPMQNRQQPPVGAVAAGAGGGQQQQQGAAGAVQMQQQSSSMGVDQQQNVGGAPQPVQPQPGQMVSLQQVPQQQQQQQQQVPQSAHQMAQQVPQQLQAIQQHSPTAPQHQQQRPTVPQQQTNHAPNQSPAVTNRQQQPMIRSSMSPTSQTSMPQQMQQSPAMSPSLSQQGIQQGQQTGQPQQIPRQTPVPVQQMPGSAPVVRQSPAPGTPATPTAQHSQQTQVRDISVPSRPGSVAPVASTVQGQVSVMPQPGQQLPQPGQQPPPAPPQQQQQQQQPQQPQQQQQQQQPQQRMGGASAQSPPPQQQMPQLPNQNIGNRMPIPKTLSIEPKGPVAIQTRPTLSGGANTAGNHVMGTPAVVKNPAFEFDEGGMGLLSKRKLEELVKQIDPDEKLDPEVEESVLELVDEFIDTVVTYACKMAKLRGSDTLDIKDMQIIMERNWNIRVPGYAADEIRTVRKFIPTQGYVHKMSALAAGKALNQTNLKGGD